MAELESKISELLNSPEGMEKVMGMARMLMGGQSQDDAGSGDAKPEQSTASEPPPPMDFEGSPDATGGFGGAAGIPDLSGLIGSALGVDLPPEALGAITGALSSGKNDHRAILLGALKPYLSDTRKPQIDKAIRAMRLARIARTVIGSGIWGKL